MQYDVAFGRRGRGLSVPLAATALCFALILMGGVCAGLLSPGWEGSWTEQVVRTQVHVVDRFFPFDSFWYQRIADDAYAWDPRQAQLKQDVAFFPLWPVVLRLVASVAPSAALARWGDVAAAAVFAFASIWAFHRLASRFLPPRVAGAATWLFALYPGASFLLLSYPTGLMNLLCVLALLAVLERRFWAAACCAGLVTASGPLGLGTAMSVWVCASLDEGARLREAGASARRLAAAALRLAALGVTAISGLGAFLLWQEIKFGDAFAFMEAQQAWAVPPGWVARLPRALGQCLIVPDFGWGIAYAAHALHAKTLVGMQAGLEMSVNDVALGMALSMFLVSLRVAPRPVVLQAGFTLALFVAFHSAVRPGNSTLRLTYCVLATFFGLAWILRERPRLTRCVFALFALMLATAAFLSAAGYHVT